MLAPDKRNRLWQVIGLMVVIGVIAIMFLLFVDFGAVGRQLRMADPRYLLSASLLLITGLIAFAVRWRLLLANKPTLSHTFHASNIGHAANILIPARAGEAARILVMGNGETVTITEATSSFVVERLIEQVIRLAALIGAVIYGVGLDISAGSVIGGLGLLLLVFGGIAWMVRHQEVTLAKGPVWLARLPRVTEAGARKSLAELLSNLAAVSAPSQLARVLLWSIIPWACFFGFFYLASLALSSGFQAEERLAISLGALALSPPSAPTQPGLFHASVVAPLAAVGYSVETLTAYTVVLHILQMIWMIGLALWGLAQLRISPRTLLAR